MTVIEEALPKVFYILKGPAAAAVGTGRSAYKQVGELYGKSAILAAALDCRDRYPYTLRPFVRAAVHHTRLSVLTPVSSENFPA